MSVVTSPAAFARRQRLGTWAPWLTAAAVVLASAWTITWAVGGFGARRFRIAHVVVTALIMLGGSGVALGYAAAWMSMLGKGMVATPARRWLIQVRDGAVHIVSGTRTVVIPLSDVQTATLVVDDSWDQMSGMETRCLVLRLRRAGRLSIPGSSEGFGELLAGLKATMSVKEESV